MNIANCLQESSKVDHRLNLGNETFKELQNTKSQGLNMIDIYRAREALNQIDSGCAREEWVRLCMSVKAAGLTFDDFHEWSRQGRNYKSERDCRSTWNSIKGTGRITAATLFKTARDQGWADTSSSNYVPSVGVNGCGIAKQSVAATKNGNADPVMVWERCVPATDAEPYIYRKHGNPDGLRVYPATADPLIIRGQNVAGYLVVPCWSDCTLQTLQFIPPGKCDKLNLPKATFGDGYFSVGDVQDHAYIVEGIGQAWAINQATGHAAVVSFGAGRMERVAKILQNKYPTACLVVVPDKGQESIAEKIAEDVSGQWVSMPADKPNNYDANDYAIEFGASALATLLECPHAPQMRFKVRTGAELCNTKPMRWLVRGVLPADGLAALYGTSGSGKSFLTLDMGCAVATGSDWFGMRVTRAPVTYVCLEGEAGLGKRISAWKIHNLVPVPSALHFITQPFDLLSDDVADLAKAIIAHGGTGGMVIIDTLNRAAPGADENSSVDMGKIITNAKELQRLIGGLVLLVHHTGKDATKGLRGHSSLYAALDGAIEVSANATRKAWSVAKSKDGVTGDAHPFKLEIIPVGTDDEGDEITSCVIAPDEAAKAVQKKMPTLGSNQGIAHKALGESLRKSVHIGMDGAPAERPCISYADALALVTPLMPCEAKRQKERAKDAIAGLVRMGVMGLNGDWLWDI